MLMAGFERTMPIKPKEDVQAFINRVHTAYAAVPSLSDFDKISTFQRWMQDDYQTTRNWNDTFDEMAHTSWYLVSTLVLPILLRKAATAAAQQMRNAGNSDHSQQNQGRAKFPRYQGTPGTQTITFPLSQQMRINSVTMSDPRVASAQAQPDTAQVSKECPFCRHYVHRLIANAGGPNRKHNLRDCLYYDIPEFAALKAEQKEYAINFRNRMEQMRK